MPSNCRCIDARMVCIGRMHVGIHNATAAASWDMPPPEKASAFSRELIRMIMAPHATIEGFNRAAWYILHTTAHLTCDDNDALNAREEFQGCASKWQKVRAWKGILENISILHPCSKCYNNFKHAHQTLLTTLSTDIAHINLGEWVTRFHAEVTRSKERAKSKILASSRRWLQFTDACNLQPRVDSDRWRIDIS